MSKLYSFSVRINKPDMVDGAETLIYDAFAAYGFEDLICDYGDEQSFTVTFYGYFYMPASLTKLDVVEKLLNCISGHDRYIGSATIHVEEVDTDPSTGYYFTIDDVLKRANK